MRTLDLPVRNHLIALETAGSKVPTTCEKAFQRWVVGVVDALDSLRRYSRRSTEDLTVGVGNNEAKYVRQRLSQLMLQIP